MFGIDDKTAIRYANAARHLGRPPRKRPNHRDTIGVVISADEFVSRRLLQVTVSWHTHPSGDQASLVHMWLHLSDLGPVRFHTAPDASLELTLDQPHDSYDMDEYGQVIVDHRIETEIGLRLELDHGEVRILNLGDELVITDTALPDALEAALR
ncbi:hypothetical protein [Nonomuraea sp. SYSU D8015]|uniref:hypothetical protein n=1 Tax=Nonomuraea sp. SYSU D8015 TaxID=2593644 RepID=UPI001660201E|nr:hypothetical protein [Nonomuraea sp. SYSU D8015]